MRPRNEDSLGRGRSGAPAAGHVFAVADGLGAYGGGDVASRMAIEALLGHAAEATDRAPRILRSGFDRANAAVFDATLSGEHPARMQTTMSALLLEPGEAHLAHVGDSRVYRMRDGDLELLTTDHTQVMEMLRLRMISPEQAVDHPGRYALTRSLGAELILRTDVRQDTLQDGDTFLLCSDGLWSKAGVEDLRRCLEGDLEAACRELVSLAIDRGSDDNASALAVRVLNAGESRAQKGRWRRLFLS